ncbi:MAG: sterol desaturase family protein, partial [Cyanobacteria bacterium J06598_3]
ASSLYWALYQRPSSRFKTKAAKLSWREIWPSIRSDVTLSILSSGIFAVCAALMTTAYTLGYTRLYVDPEQHGLWYIGASFLLVLILQDAYFYFTHRLSHHPKCYKWLHQGHHQSKNPTPWTAFAFDPAESMIQAIYLIGVTIFIPMHLFVLVAVVMVMTMGALFHHFGVRLFDDSPLGKWMGSWIVGTTHHWLHHRKYTVHYGLYFTFWDRLLGTHFPGYATVLSPKERVGKSATSSVEESLLEA